MAEDKLKWEEPVPGIDALTDDNDQVYAKAIRDETTRLWRPSIVGRPVVAPEFSSFMGARAWVKRKLDSQYGVPPIEEETK